MTILETMGGMGHEQVLFCREPELGLRAIIAIHDTTLGPSLGGVRIYPYEREEDALTDVLRLSRGMTYKNAIAGLDWGGGKAVIIGPRSVKTEGALRAFGRHIHSLGGRYLVAEDMNATAADMAMIARETPYVTGLPPSQGGIGEPGPVTAFGVFQGVRGALKHRTGSSEVRGRRVAIQGLGAVGGGLARYLHESGAELVVCDIDPVRVAAAVAAYGATAVDLDAYVDTACDVLSPCAIGAVLTEATIPRLRAGIVAGGANNILGDEVADAERLTELGVDVAPDYVVNAGGVIAMWAEWHGRSLDAAMDHAAGIYDTTIAVFQRASENRCTTFAASKEIALDRIAAVRQARKTLLPPPLTGPPR